jgi:hypothetical protein
VFIDGEHYHLTRWASYRDPVGNDVVAALLMGGAEACRR